MTNQATLELEDFPAAPNENGHWLHEDGRTFFLWPARDLKTNAAVRVEVEVTSIRHEAVAEQLKPSRKAIEFAARELYLPGTPAVRLMRPDAYWMQRGH
ncbi:hypothetical protein [Hyphomicrobium sp.]|uniref:hypothetical protein n=1 Tax=Hyphomicrobium sp. TaxID=82 RepID=UPI002E2ED955|nr:hypothetical protein [Hyphomicrobium sp.]HEX2842394.1 hypothetical protein [Hyphomicrobium sp.]